MADDSLNFYKEIQDRLKKLEDLTSFLERNMQLGKFRMDSTEEHHLSIITDSNCGIIFKGDGNVLFGSGKTSSEVVGDDKDFYPENGAPPAKIIRAVRGDIVLDAENGNIVLRGKNVTVVANDALGGQVYISSSKLTQIDSPNIKHQGDNFTSAMSMNSSMTAATLEGHAQLSNEQSSASEEKSSSFFGKILAAIKRFKEFFNSICAPPI